VFLLKPELVFLFEGLICGTYANMMILLTAKNTRTMISIIDFNIRFSFNLGDSRIFILHEVTNFFRRGGGDLPENISNVAVDHSNTKKSNIFQFQNKLRFLPNLLLLQADFLATFSHTQIFKLQICGLKFVSPFFSSYPIPLLKYRSFHEDLFPEIHQLSQTFANFHPHGTAKTFTIRSHFLLKSS
jgi:hypothetical protein